MSFSEDAVVERVLSDAGVSIAKTDKRAFPGEKWLIVYVSGESLAVAQSLAGSIERALNDASPDDTPYAVTFRAGPEPESTVEGTSTKGGLGGRNINQLINLLEARSRTSDALPSLKYVEDPRASLSAVAASRHQLIFGRRGVGKTSLMLEAKQVAERDGHATVWMNAHVLRHLDAPSASVVLAETILASLVQHGGSSNAPSFARLQALHDELVRLRSDSEHPRADIVSAKLADLNLAARGVLRHGVVCLYVFIDDFYLLPASVQPLLLDNAAGMLRDCDGWLKVASIERLTRAYEPSSRIGLEVPHDASKIDLDITLEDPAAAQKFLESVLSNYTTAAGIRQPSSIAKPEALGRLVLASGGVPRDYLNLFASSIVVARQSRAQPREIGREDVAKAAGEAARSKKRDLEQDVSSESSALLLSALEELSEYVKGRGYTYFRVDMAEKGSVGYNLLGQLVDLRFVHLVQAGLSDQHRAGTRYEAYTLDLSEYTDVRLKRRLDMLDLSGGTWTRRLTGKARTEQRLAGTQLRDLLRHSPLVHVGSLVSKKAR